MTQSLISLYFIIIITTVRVIMSPSIDHYQLCFGKMDQGVLWLMGILFKHFN